MSDDAIERIARKVADPDADDAERWETWREAADDVRTLLAALDAERQRATAMHRRAQRAEAIADRVASEYRDTGRWGATLASYVWHAERRRAEAAEAEVERLRAEGMCDACAGTGEALSGPCGCGGTGRAVDLLREVRDVLARTEREVERLRDGVRSVADDLTEHADDGDCAGPHGTGRRGACADCRAAMHLRALLDPPVRPAPASASEPPCTCLSDAGWGSPRRSCPRHP